MEPLCGSNLVRYAKGFTILELVLVMVIVASLMAVASSYYVQILAGMSKEAVRTQANYFRAATTTLRSQWFINRVNAEIKPYLWLGREVFLTSQGWLANSDKMLLSGANNQTVFECWQLWKVVFKGEQTVTMDGVNEQVIGDYHVSSLSGKGCRFELSINDKKNSLEGPHFDYFLADGRIEVFLGN